MTKVLLDTVSLLGLAKALEAPVEEFIRRGGRRRDLHEPSKPVKFDSEELSANITTPASEAPTAMVLDKKEERDVGSQPGVVSEADAMDVLLVFQSVMTLTYRYVQHYSTMAGVSRKTHLEQMSLYLFKNEYSLWMHGMHIYVQCHT